MKKTDIPSKITNWESFRLHLRSLDKKGKGDAFELLTQRYLQLDPIYATKLKHVWHLTEVPSKIAHKLCLPIDDKGIDLIAETKEGEYWAIQCKYREDQTHSLTWRELSTFTGLAFGICKGISFGLVCTNTERLTKVFKHQDRIGFCSLDAWMDLDKEFFKKIHALDKRKPEKLEPRKPREHQRPVIKDAYKHFVKENQKRGKLIMPCGTGKSLAAYWIAQKLKAKRILIAVPSLALVRQTLKVWLRESIANNQPIDWLCVCSDESAGRIGQDDISVLKQDLGVPCATNPQEISAWLKTAKTGLTIVFTTYQSGKSIADAAKKMRYAFDIGILDEAHKTVGTKDKLFSHLLHDKNISIKKRIFMTATERRYLGQSDDIASMENEEFYGDTFSLLTFKRALEFKPPILSDYKIITILVTKKEIAEYVKTKSFVRPDKGRWDKDVEAQMLASLIALRKAMKKYPIKHAVSFHSSIQKAQVFQQNSDVFSKVYPKYGKLETFHVSGNTPTGTRAKTLIEFENSSRALITNARCLTEGVDIPDIDCVLFADPRKSQVDIVQAVGRALRPAKNKEQGYVILPILHDTEKENDSLLESEEFKEILTTLRALAANDDRIIEYFRLISSGKRASASSLIDFGIDEKFGKKIQIDEFVKALELKCWSRLAKLSWRPFEEAREFVRRLGLKSRVDWDLYCSGYKPQTAKKPEDIPMTPWVTYKGCGWLSMGDWLGTDYIADQLRVYLPFKTARSFVGQLGLKNEHEWRKYSKGENPHKGKKPDGIPANPSQTYKGKGWIGFGDWLGTGTISNQMREFWSYKKARTFVHSLRLKSSSDWRLYCRNKLKGVNKKPATIPSEPSETYRNQGWVGFGDWLGTGNIADRLMEYLPFDKARAFVQTLNLRSKSEWAVYCKGLLLEKGKKPDNIPTGVSKTYRNKGWCGWGDWLGTGAIASFNRSFRPFEQARQFVHGLKLKSQSEWSKYCKGQLLRKGIKPNDIPTTPSRNYKESGWINMGDWLGTGTVAPFLRDFRSYSDAKIFVRRLKIKSKTEWENYCKSQQRPVDISSNPSKTYHQKGWSGWGDFLGTGTIAPRLRNFPDYKKARSFVHTLKLKTWADWREYCAGRLQGKNKKPDNISSNPQRTYRNKGWINIRDWLGND